MAAGNVRGAMRPQGRSPSFFIVGLFLVVAILGFNYWSLSKRNHDLATQLLNMQDQLRLCISKRMTVERRGSNIVSELKKCETALDMDKNEVARKESEVISLTEQLKIKDVQIISYETKGKEMEELRTSLKTCEENNSGIMQELQKKKEELKANQATGVNAETCKVCKDQWVFDQKTFLNGIDKVLGPTALLQLKNAGVDIGNYALEISAQLKNSQMQHNEDQSNLPTKNNIPVVSQSAGNQEIGKVAVPAETGQNAGPAGGNAILGVNSANSVNQGANSPIANQDTVGHSVNNNQGIAVPGIDNNNDKAGGVENQGAGAPSVNKDVAGGNLGAAVPPANNNVVGGNPRATVIPVNNGVADGNPGAVVPPVNNDIAGGNPGADLPPANNDIAGGNPGAGLPPANNDIAGGNPGAGVPPNNDIAGGNPGAGAPPANNDVAGGNQGVVPPVNNNDGGGVPVIQDVGAGEIKNNLPQNNNEGVMGNPGGVVPLLNNNNEGGDVGNSLDIGVADKLKEQDIAGGKLIPTESSHLNGAPVGAALNDNFYVNHPKIESKETKTGLLDILKNNNILFENQYKIAPGINNSNLPALQDGVNPLTSLKKHSDSVTGSSINITKSGAQTPKQLSNNTAFSIKTSNAILMSPVSSADQGSSSHLAVKSNKTDSSNTGPGSIQMKPIVNSNLIKYLQTNSSGPNSNIKEDNLKGGFNTIEDSIDKMQKSMTLDEDKMNSLEKNHS